MDALRASLMAARVIITNGTHAMRVAAAADYWDRCRHERESRRAEAADALIDAVRRYRQATGRDTMTGEAPNVR